MVNAKSKNMEERVKVLRAMDLLARYMNDEALVVDDWFVLGVADGDIDDATEDCELYDYVELDDDFAEIMNTFLRNMSRAYKSGGLYVDRVVSGFKRRRT